MWLSAVGVVVVVAGCVRVLVVLFGGCFASAGLLPDVVGLWCFGAAVGLLWCCPAVLCCLVLPSVVAVLLVLRCWWLLPSFGGAVGCRFL